MNSCTEEILLARARDGNETGFEAVVDAHSPRLLRLALRLTGNREDAEDIVQEAFLRLHRTLGRFRGESSLATWLHRTTIRLAIDHLRRRRLREKIFLFRRTEEEPDPVELARDGGDSPADRLHSAEIRARLQDAMQGLSARQRVVFTLRHFEEMPLREIADTLGLEEGTVKAHLHRAVSAVREQMRELKGNTP